MTARRSQAPVSVVGCAYGHPRPRCCLSSSRSLSVPWRPALWKRAASGVYRLLGEVGHSLLRRGGDALASLNIPAAALPTTSFGRPAPPVPWSPESIANSSGRGRSQTYDSLAARPHRSPRVL